MSINFKLKKSGIKVRVTVSVVQVSANGRMIYVGTIST